MLVFRAHKVREGAAHVGHRSLIRPQRDGPEKGPGLRCWTHEVFEEVWYEGLLDQG